MNLRPHIEKFARRLEEVQAALSDPKLFENPNRYQGDVARILAAEGADGCRRTLSQDGGCSGAAYRIAEKPNLEKSELAELAREEITELQAREQKLAKQVQMKPLRRRTRRIRAIRSLKFAREREWPESALFAADLFRMYTRYAEGSPLEGGTDGQQPV